MTHVSDRLRSLKEYHKECPATMKPHDWRYASDAPGWELGDDCTRCEACQLKGIKPIAEPPAGQAGEKP